MFDKNFILVGKKIIAVDFEKWTKLFTTHSRKVIHVTFLPGRVKVSTVFLGYDYSWRKHASPLVFETMIFGGKFDTWVNRYYTLRGAKAGHRKAVIMAKKYKRFAVINRSKKYKNRISKLPFVMQLKIKYPNSNFSKQ